MLLGSALYDHRVDHEDQLAAVVDLLHRVPNEPATAARLALAVLARRPAGPARRPLAGFTAGALAGLPARARRSSATATGKS